MINDDKVAPDFFPISRELTFELFSLDAKKRHAEDSAGRSLGYADKHTIIDLEADWGKLQQSSIWKYNKENTEEKIAIAEDVFGDIIPVVCKNENMRWFFMPTKDIVDMMGLEKMLYSMYDYPDLFKELMSRIVKDRLAYAKWLENEKLLDLNNGNDYVGSGSYGFTDELTKTERGKVGAPLLKDLWLNINSQESVGISPDMYHEFVYPYYEEMAKEFGLTYYGCCEPVHDVWDSCLKDMPNLRKVSISAWCNEEIMGERLRGSNVIYSRKPSPNFIGVEKNFDGEYLENTYPRH